MTSAVRRAGASTTTERHVVSAETEEISDSVARYLESRLKTAVEHDFDLFASGLANSMFAMELVVHLEKSFDVMIEGSELKLDNFRTVDSMTALVSRLRSAQVDGG